RGMTRTSAPNSRSRSTVASSDDESIARKAVGLMLCCCKDARNASRCRSAFNTGTMRPTLVCITGQDLFVGCGGDVASRYCGAPWLLVSRGRGRVVAWIHDTTIAPVDD